MIIVCLRVLLYCEIKIKVNFSPICYADFDVLFEGLLSDRQHQFLKDEKKIILFLTFLIKY